jgi:hypothetical protein
LGEGKGELVPSLSALSGFRTSSSRTVERRYCTRFDGNTPSDSDDRSHPSVFSCSSNLLHGGHAEEKISRIQEFHKLFVNFHYLKNFMDIL